MARADKVAAVAEMADEFRNSNAAVLTEYRGLSVKQLRELRRALGDNVTYAVVKNTLTRIAATEAGVDAFDDLLQGPSAIAFIKGDAVEAAKALRDFGKANPPLVIKAGVLDGKPLSPAEISKIADLESREVLLGMLAGALLASLQGAVSLFNAPLSQAARVVGALQAKAEGDPSILAGGAGTPPAIQPEDASDDIAGNDHADGGAAAIEVPATDSPPDRATPVADEAQPGVTTGVAVTEAPDTDSTPETLERVTNDAADAGAGTEAVAGPEETTEG